MNIEERIELIERTMKQAKRTSYKSVLFVILVLIVTLAISPVSRTTLHAEGADHPADKHSVIQANGFRIIDSKGLERASLEVDKDDTPALVLYDAKHTTRISLSIDKDGSAGLVLADSSGKTTVGLYSASDGQSGLAVGSKQHVSITNQNDFVTINLQDSNGKTRAAIVMGKDGRTKLAFLDENGSILNSIP